MSYFQLPKTIINDVEQCCTWFWWGDGEVQKKIRWGKWKELCNPKVHGGMGFCDLELCNQALLGKQVWRLLTNPESLLGRVLKARYFSNRTIIDADIGRNPSLCWRSLCWGKEILKLRLQMRVGDGTTISICDSKWIPLPGEFKVCSPRVFPADMSVAGLLDENGRWNSTLVNASFLNFEAEMILAIPRPRFAMADSWLWHDDLKGAYTVKSGYAIAFNTRNGQVGTTSTIMETWGKTLWSLQVPPKIKIFFWKACLDIIPTYENLQRHHIPILTMCPLCGGEIETTHHELLSRGFLGRVWDGWMLRSGMERWQYTSFMDLYIILQKSTNLLEQFMVMVWQVLAKRNGWVHRRADWGRTAIEKVAANYLKEFKLTRANDTIARFEISLCMSSNRPRVPIITVDAFKDSAENIYDVGVVIRDELFTVVGAYARSLEIAASVLMVELDAICDGLMEAQRRRIFSCVICSDSTQAIEHIHSSNTGGDVGVVVSDILCMRSMMQHVEFFYIPRTLNNEAHKVERYSLSCSTIVMWNALDIP